VLCFWVIFYLFIVLSVIRVTASDFPFGILKHFFSFNCGRHPAPINSNSLNMLYILSKRLKVTITRIVIAKKCLSFRNANTINNTRSRHNLYASKILIDLRERSFTNDGKNWEQIKKKMYMSQPTLKTKRKGKVRNCHVIVSVVVCKIFTFQSSSPKLFYILEPTLTITCIRWLRSRNYWFWSEIQHDWPIMCPDWMKSPKCSSEKKTKWEFFWIFRAHL
jgi:hypothetical protein